MDIELRLSTDEVNAILQVLGQLPTSSNAWPLLMKVKGQAESQSPNPAELSPPADNPV